MSARSPITLPPGLAAADDADDAGAADAGDDLVAAEALELFGDRRRGAVHVVEQFRMGVQVAPPFGDLGVQVGDAVDDRHGVHPCWGIQAVAQSSRTPAAPRLTASSAPVQETGNRSAFSLSERSREPVAQSVEHVTFNHGVAGSNPAGLTNKIKWLVRIVKKGISAKVRYRYKPRLGRAQWMAIGVGCVWGLLMGLGDTKRKLMLRPAGAGLRTKRGNC